MQATWRGMEVAVKLFSSADAGTSDAQMISFKAETKVMAQLSKVHRIHSTNPSHPLFTRTQRISAKRNILPS
jgi:hypothetical protein